MEQLLIWNESNSVGVKEIDEQHKKIFGMINELYSAMKESKEKQVLNGLIAGLLDYAKYHFSTEEKYFDEFNYEGKEMHIDRHHRYVDKILQFEKEFEEKKDFLSYDILDFLEDWWIKHINGADKGYTECFHKHGLY